MNMSTRTQFCIASLLQHSSKRGDQFTCVNSSFLPVCGSPQRSLPQYKNNSRNKSQDCFHIIHWRLLSLFFAFWLTSRSIRKISWAVFFQSCCIDKSTNVYSTEPVSIQVSTKYTNQVLTAACQSTVNQMTALIGWKIRPHKCSSMWRPSFMLSSSFSTWLAHTAELQYSVTTDDCELLTLNKYWETS